MQKEFIASKKGHTFNGWFENENHQGDKITINNFTVTEDKTFYGIWKINQYTVNFVLNGGNIDGENTLASQTVNYNTKITKPKDPASANLSFFGWYQGDNFFDVETVTITENIILYARYDVVVVTFDKTTGSVTGLKNEYKTTDDLVVKIPPTIEGVAVQKISAGAFENTLKLKEVIFIGEGITTIGVIAFKNSGLTKIKLPNQLRVLEEEVFNSCRSLIEVILPDNLNTIKARSLNRCVSLLNITIPASVSTIGMNSFEFCTKLTVKILSKTPATLGISISRSVFGKVESGIIAHVKAILVPNTDLATYQAAEGWRDYAADGSYVDLMSGY